MNRFEERIEKLRALFKDTGIEGLYISSPANVSYFTGTKGADLALWITDTRAAILTDFRYKEMAQELTWFEFQDTTKDFKLYEFLNSCPKKKIGIESEHMLVSSYLKLKEGLTGKQLIPVTGLVESLRVVKDDYEIEATTKACQIADDCFTHMLSWLKPGLTEKEVALEIEYFMKSNGAEALSFDTIVASGPNSSRPHAVPCDRKLQDGDFLTMDYGCKYHGYCSDMTRTVAIGHASDEMRKVYNTVLEAQLYAEQNIRAGLPGSLCHEFAAQVIDEAGYGEFFGHGLGHGTGLEIHELPRYAAYYNNPIPENSIVSVEPGIYLPGKFGVRIEDLAIVKSNGIIKLVNSPKELIII